jgi:hypothetical protein
MDQRGMPMRSRWKDAPIFDAGAASPYGQLTKKLDGQGGWEQPYEAMSVKPLSSSDFVSESSRIVVVGLLSVLGLISLGAAAD